jgi:hypothetical protein
LKETSLVALELSLIDNDILLYLPVFLKEQKLTKRKEQEREI